MKSKLLVFIDSSGPRRYHFEAILSTSTVKVFNVTIDQYYRPLKRSTVVINRFNLVIKEGGGTIDKKRRD
jgi:hypothetical protein